MITCEPRSSRRPWADPGVQETGLPKRSQFPGKCGVAGWAKLVEQQVVWGTGWGVWRFPERSQFRGKWSFFSRLGEWLEGGLPRGQAQAEGGLKIRPVAPFGGSAFGETKPILRGRADKNRRCRLGAWSTGVVCLAKRSQFRGMGRRCRAGERVGTRVFWGTGWGIWRFPERSQIGRASGRER